MTGILGRDSEPGAIQDSSMASAQGVKGTPGSGGRRVRRRCGERHPGSHFPSCRPEYIRFANDQALTWEKVSTDCGRRVGDLAAGTGIELRSPGGPAADSPGALAEEPGDTSSHSSMPPLTDSGPEKLDQERVVAEEATSVRGFLWGHWGWMRNTHGGEGPWRFDRVANRTSLPDMNPARIAIAAHWFETQAGR